ncbi:carboxy terminal-processing peptidase [Thalassotalea eurytherma]|uniref:Tail-specific protease n=1 Tax=Thalassotalea eurytherma TaxID=1144278 RepID=A0ABQ6H223_9GAMM|nr:carboxy terminal-processing peptidase [Thalassotalea eurytherma]GLX82238.1 tail-specific protease [Thalassotalea eurytherma]
MHKLCRIAIAVSLSAVSLVSFGKDVQIPEELPVLAPESQHAVSTKRITAQFMRGHYKKFKIDNDLSHQIFDRYIKQLDFNKNVFLASDIDQFSAFKDDFDAVIARGQLQVAYDIYNLNLQRRVERYEYALTLLDKPFDFTKEERYHFDREDAEYAKSVEELNELWRQKVKYDALNLTLAEKEWEKIQEILGKRYKSTIKRLKQSESEDVYQIVMNSFARVVEPHTSYLSPRNAERFQMEMNLSLEGIGAVLRAEDDYTVIQSIVPGGPADKSSQLKPKDRIVGVSQDDEEFVDVIGWRLDDVVDLIKGPKGTKVRLEVLPGESDSLDSIKNVSIIRDKIKLEERAAKSEVYIDESIEGQARKLGVIEIPSFYNNLSKDVKKEIESLKAENVEGIIVDLRGNGGGSLTEATLLTGLFIDKGPVVQVRDGADRIAVNSDRDGISYYDGPLTVMVDRYSASASEIFSAAIQDYNRGIIVGENTFGKGTVQQHRGLGRVYDLYEKPLGSIQYTIAKFYRINGGSTQHKGVAPDIAFPSAVDPEEWGESKEENALVWDQVPKANYRQVTTSPVDVSYLDSLHQQRIKENVEFEYLLKDIAKYKAEKDDKSISLNLEERKQKREERKTKQLTRANERLAKLGKEAITTIDDLPEELEELDVFLDETAKITFDYIELNRLAKN